MSNHARRPRHTRILTAAGVVLVVSGVVAVVVAVQSQKQAPRPPASAATPVAVAPSQPPSPIPAKTSPATSVAGTSTAASATSATPAAPTSPTSPMSPTRGPSLHRSLPVHLSIPAIGVNSDLKQIGLTAGGQIRTPPLEPDDHAYWLDVSPTPGQLGPAAIIGHVDSAAWGPAVFFDLGNLRRHDTIAVTRADRTVAVFEITHVDEYRKADFPTMAVYGNTDHAALRLITCGGSFDESTGHYDSNIVVYAALVSSHHS